MLAFLNATESPDVRPIDEADHEEATAGDGALYPAAYFTAREAGQVPQACAHRGAFSRLVGIRDSRAHRYARFGAGEWTMTEEKNKFTNRADEYTNMSAAISIHDSLLEIYFKTPDQNGDIYIKVPWSRKRMEKYLNPFVFGELVDPLKSPNIFRAKTVGR